MRAKEFYKFMVERETIRHKKAAGDPKPWTDDGILQSYKFTNVKREHDKTTRTLLQHLYDHSDFKTLTKEAQFINCATYRYFNVADLARDIGIQTHFLPEHIRKTAKDRQKRGEQIWTNAYMVNSFKAYHTGNKIDTVVDFILTPLWAAIPGLLYLIKTTGSWELVIKEMMKLPGYGGSGFNAKEVILDTFFTDIWNGKLPEDYNTWCLLGPGGKRGLNRVFNRPPKAKLSEAQGQEELKMLWNERKKYLPKGFVKLYLQDVQFFLCETDKYERTRLGEGKPKNKYNGVK